MQGVKDSSVCFLNIFIYAFNIFAIFAMSFFHILYTIFKGIDTEDLIIWRIIPYHSSLGNFAVILFVFKQSPYYFTRHSTFCNSIAFHSNP
jgi:hypothetical protein